MSEIQKSPFRVIFLAATILTVLATSSLSVDMKTLRKKAEAGDAKAQFNLKLPETLLGKMHSFDGRRGGHRLEQPESAIPGVFEEWVGLGQREVFHNLRLPEERIQSLFDAAVHSLVLHSPGGEWDSNGEALWILRRYCELTGRPPKPEWRRSIERGARWIRRNRIQAEGEGLHSGLLPPGFSAEHLGPNNYYYWDDFRGIAGLHAASRLLPPARGKADPSAFREEGERLVLASGILPEWLEAEGPISFGPAPTTFGEVRVEILRRGRRSEVQWSGSWRRTPLRVEVRLPGFTALDASAVQGSALLEPEAGS